MRNYGAVRELSPTSDQIQGLLSAVGANRFAQNWALGFVKAQMDANEKQSWSSISLHTAWREHREEVAPWYGENSKETYQYGVERAANALSNFIKSKKGQRKGKRVGFPRFRRRGHNDSASFTAARLRDTGLAVMIPRIGEIKLKEAFTLPQGATLQAVIVRPKAGRWFVTFRLREKSWEEPSKKVIRQAVGVDAGVGERFATLSDGSPPVDNPRFFRTDERKMSFLGKALRRKEKGSSRRKKVLDKIAVLHYRIANRRKDFIHKFTTDLVKNHDEIIIEDLNLHGMKSGLKLGKSVSDVAWSEVRRQLEYKASWYGTSLTVVSRWYPSSKQCHVCGYTNFDLSLSDRTWTCNSCGTKHDRDTNAALNLLTQSSVAESSSVIARRDSVRLSPVKAAVSEARSPVAFANRI